jgi:hypothetical protein
MEIFTAVHRKHLQRYIENIYSGTQVYAVHTEAHARLKLVSVIVLTENKGADCRSRQPR